MREMLTEDRVGEVDSVVHLAATADSSATKSDVTENNLRNTQHVTEFCSRTGSYMVFPSSTSVYSSSESVVDEQTEELEPSGAYAQCKIIEERVIAANCATDSFTIFRLGTIYGISPGMRFHTAVNRFCWQAIHRQPVHVWQTAYDQVRPYLGVQDAVGAIAQVVTKQRAATGTINLVSCNVTVRQVLSTIEEFVGETSVSFVDSYVMNSLSFSASTRKAEALGFTFDDSLTPAVGEILRLLGLGSRNFG